MSMPTGYQPVTEDRTHGAAVFGVQDEVAGGWLSSLSVVIFILAVGMIIGVIGAGFTFHYVDDMKKIDKNDNRLDDLEDLVDFSGATLVVKNNTSINGTLTVNDTLVANDDVLVSGTVKASGFEMDKSYTVCSDGSVTMGKAVSINHGCITNGFDPHPGFVYDTQAQGVIDEKIIVSLGSSNAVALYSDAADSGNLKIRALRYANGGYDPVVLSTNVQGTTGAATTWAATAINDGKTVFVVRTNLATNDDVVLVRCTSDGTNLACDAGVTVISQLAINIVDIEWLGTVGATHWFSVLVITNLGAVEARVFSASVTANSAIIGVDAGAVAIDTDVDYYNALVANRISPAQLVRLGGSYSNYGFAVVFGGVGVVADVSVMVFNLGPTPSDVAPALVDITGLAPFVLYTRGTPGDLNAQFSAAVAPGTNVIFVTSSDRNDVDSSVLRSVNAQVDATMTTTVFLTPLGQGTILQPAFGVALGVDADRYQAACLSSTVCVVAYRAIHNLFNQGKVAVVELGADGAIISVRDRATYSSGHVTNVCLAAVSEHHFLVSFVETAPVTGQEQVKLVRGELPDTDPVMGEIHFGLAAKGRAPVGVALQTCSPTTACQVRVFGLYAFDSSSPLAKLGHASRVFAYTDGSMGITALGPGDPFTPSSNIGVHVGGGSMLVQPSGLPEPL